MPESAGPYPIDGVKMTAWIIKFDEKGTCTSPKTQDALLAAINKDPKPTHAIFMSHGWNSDFADAIDQYQAFLKAFEEVTKNHPPRGDYRPVFVGINWPSVWFPIDRGPALAGLDSKAAARQVVGTVAEKLDDPAARQRLDDLLNKDRLSLDEAREAAALARPSLVNVEDSEIPPAAEPLTEGDLVDAARAVQAVIEPIPPATRPGAFNPGGPPAADIAGLEWLNPRNLIRLFSLYQMKDRAGRVGSSGLAKLLRELLKTDIPIHLVGHSFGAKAMLSALCAPAPLRRPVASALLLQPAISYLSFATVVPGRTGHGGYIDALDQSHIAKPIFSTYSASDFPLHDVFHLALRRAADLGELRIAAAAGPPPNRYAALGGYGPGGVGPNGNGQVLVNPIKRPGDAYAVDGKVRIFGLDGSAAVDFPAAKPEARIGCHGCIANPYTAWALHQQMF